MALGAVILYNQFPGIMLRNPAPHWDNPTAGAYMWVLATSAYTPLATHTTGADFGAAVITAGSGAPINAPSRVVADIVAGAFTDHWLQSPSADFGSVTLTAKYLVCVQPVTAGTYAATAKLCFYVDLNVGAGLSLSTTGSQFLISQPTNGWERLQKT